MKQHNEHNQKTKTVQRTPRSGITEHRKERKKTKIKNEFPPRKRN